MTETTAAPLLSDLLEAFIDGYESAGFPQATLANASAILMENVADINWAGFYLYDEKINELILGPFQGKIATVHIKPENGVVGAAFTKQATLVIANVHEFPGHIACDIASNAEIVIPITRADGTKVGVLDIDSTKLARFSDQDQHDLEHFVDTLLKYI
ncbi:MAG: GAF domain-containing protein [Lactobacillaceae bacterium]|jgi:GAF domain-containing protein|nr:GAF domain-containing protein [Lactobacillaceae bacterium]